MFQQNGKMWHFLNSKCHRITHTFSLRRQFDSGLVKLRAPAWQLLVDREIYGTPYVSPTQRFCWEAISSTPVFLHHEVIQPVFHLKMSESTENYVTFWSSTSKLPIKNMLMDGHGWIPDWISVLISFHASCLSSISSLTNCGIGRDSQNDNMTNKLN